MLPNDDECKKYGCISKGKQDSLQRVFPIKHKNYLSRNKNQAKDEESEPFLMREIEEIADKLIDFRCANYLPNHLDPKDKEKFKDYIKEVMNDYLKFMTTDERNCKLFDFGPLKAGAVYKELYALSYALAFDLVIYDEKGNIGDFQWNYCHFRRCTRNIQTWKNNCYKKNKSSRTKCQICSSHENVKILVL